MVSIFEFLESKTSYGIEKYTVDCRDLIRLFFSFSCNLISLVFSLYTSLQLFLENPVGSLIFCSLPYLQWHSQGRFFGGGGGAKEPMKQEMKGVLWFATGPHKIGSISPFVAGQEQTF